MERCGHYFLEYDSPRAGDFAPMRLVPKYKSVVLGLVSTKTPVMEDKAALKRRVEEASRHVDLDRLAVSPQCGFASAEEGNPITPATQEAKLRLVVELAQEIWGDQESAVSSQQSEGGSAIRLITDY